MIRTPETGEVQNVTVPMAESDQISQGTYRSIAEQCGADDFEALIESIDTNP